MGALRHPIIRSLLVARGKMCLTQREHSAKTSATSESNRIEHWLAALNSVHQCVNPNDACLHANEAPFNLI